MKKWNYLVASVLMLGAISVTSCIDNDEPAGINDLRGAKAEYIRAKTQWELASAEIEKVKIEREQVALEQDKLALELGKLNLEREQALTDWAKDSLAAKSSLLKADQEVVLKNIAVKLTQAEEAYQKALVDLQIASLTYKDDAFRQKIDEYTGLLAVARRDLTGEINTLYQRQQSLIDFLADTDTYVKRLNLAIDEKTGLLAIQNQVLTDLKGFAATPWTDWNTKLADVGKEIAQINQDVTDRMGEINKQKSGIQPVEADIAREEAKKETRDQSFTVPVVDAALQSDFVNLILNVSTPAYITNNIASIFIAKNDATFEMTQDWTVSGASLKYMAGDMFVFVSDLEKNYRDRFADAYYSRFVQHINREADPTEAQLAKAQGELDRMALDKAAVYATYQADSTEWTNAYTDYTVALKNYDNYLVRNTYNAIAAKVDAYRALAPADRTQAAADGLQAELKAYYGVRNPLDGQEPLYPDPATGDPVKLATLFKATDGITLDLFNEVIDTWSNPKILGSPAIVTSAAVYNEPDASAEGAVQRLIRASDKAFGTGELFSQVVEPKYVGGVPYLPNDVDLRSGSYAEYKTMYQYYDIFASIGKWMQLDSDIRAIAKGFKDQLLAIDDQVAVLNQSIAAKKDAIWKAEFEVLLLDVTQRDRLSSDNIYVNGVVVKEGEKQALESLQASIVQAIEHEGSITYVYYDGDTHSYKKVTGTIENLISQQESRIINAEEALARANAKLQEFEELGAMSYENKVQYQETLEQAIADQQLAVDEKQAAVDRLNETLKDFLAAYAD